MKRQCGAATARQKLETVATTIKLTPEVRAGWQATTLEYRTLTITLVALVLDCCRRRCSCLRRTYTDYPAKPERTLGRLS